MLAGRLLYPTRAMIDWVCWLESEWERRAITAEVIRLGNTAIETIARQIAADPMVVTLFGTACGEPVEEKTTIEKLRLKLGVLGPATITTPCRRPG